MSLSQNPDEDPTRIALSRGKTTVLSGEQRERYARDGFLSIEGLVGTDWLERLRTVTAEFVEKSRGLSEATPVFDLEPDHSAKQPRLRSRKSRRVWF